MSTSKFKAGAAMKEITPALGSLINGDFITHYAREIHDPLYSKALVLEDRDLTIAIIVVDICAMQKDFLDDLKKKIFSQTGISPKNVLISSTHTHAAGSIESLLLGGADLPYRQKLGELIIQSVTAAKKNLKPAKVAYESIDIPEHVVCRRYFMKPGYKAVNPVTGGLDIVKTNPLGDEDKIEKRVSPTDPELNYLAIRGIDDEWISLLANYCLHYVGDWENGTITADYFGAFARLIQVKLGAGPDFIPILSNGTSGDANIVDFLQPQRYPEENFAKAELISNDLAEKVSQSLANITWEDNPTLSAQYEELPIPIRRPSADELNTAKQVVAETNFENLVLMPSHIGNEDSFKRIYAREQILLKEYPDTILFPIQALKIGTVIIGGLGGEFFSETGLSLKTENSKRNYFTICLANGYVGYVPPEHEFELGGYETWRCRTSFLEEKAEEIIRKKLLELVNQIK